MTISEKIKAAWIYLADKFKSFSLLIVTPVLILLGIIWKFKTNADKAKQELAKVKQDQELKEDHDKLKELKENADKKESDYIAIRDEYRRVYDNKSAPTPISGQSDKDSK